MVERLSDVSSKTGEKCPCWNLKFFKQIQWNKIFFRMYGFAVIEVMSLSGHLSNIDEIRKVCTIFCSSQLEFTKTCALYCCLYNYFGGSSIINQHHWLNDLYKKRRKKEQSSETFLRSFLTTWQRKCNNKLIMCRRKNWKRKGGKHWKDPTLGLRHTILWCKSFLLSTHKSVVCSRLWSFM